MDPVFFELVKILKEGNQTVSTAESCTGGMISQMITDVSGSSEVFGLGIVSYSIDQKIKTLGVDEAVIKNFGVYSEQTAQAMAKAVRTLSNSSVSVATTGLAGPGGEIAGLPVGTVFIGVDGERGTISKKCFFEADSREKVRILTAQKAAELCIDYLRG